MLEEKSMTEVTLVPYTEVESTLAGVEAFVRQFKNERYEGIAEDLHDILSDNYLDSGSFGKVYKLGDYVIKVMYPSEDFEGVIYHVPTALEEGQILADLQSIKAFPRLYYFDHNVIIMERVSGKPLWRLSEEEAEAIPRACWHQLIGDLIEVTKLGYRPIDVSTNNVFWDEATQRFNIIDVGFYCKESNIEKLHMMRFFSYYLFNDLYEELAWEYKFDEEDYCEPAFN